MISVIVHTSLEDRSIPLCWQQFFGWSSAELNTKLQVCSALCPLNLWTDVAAVASEDKLSTAVPKMSGGGYSSLALS